MNALEFPIEALDFNYLSYSFLTAINRLCAWLSVVTTVISFWRVKSQSALPDPKPESLLLETSITSETHNLSPVLKTTPSYTSDGECNMGVKFTFYYKDVYGNTVDDVCDDEDDYDSGETVVSQNVDWCCNDLKEIIRVRMGDLEWYRCQDLTVLDGNVVRLWDGGRRRRNTASESLMYGVATAAVW